jgi:hypothetical protein
MAGIDPSQLINPGVADCPCVSRPSAYFAGQAASPDSEGPNDGSCRTVWQSKVCNT